MTYGEVFKHLSSTGKGLYIRPEASMNIAPDEYLPKSWNVLTELDIVPPNIKREAPFLGQTMAAILANANKASASVLQADQVWDFQANVIEGDSARAEEIAKDNTKTKEPVEGYGMHSAGTTAAAKQTIVNIKEGFELHLEESTLVGRRHRKTGSVSKDGTDSGTSMSSNTQATDSKGDGLEGGAGAVLGGGNPVTAVRSTTTFDTPPMASKCASSAKITRPYDPNTSKDISSGAPNTAVNKDNTTAGPSTKTTPQAPNPTIPTFSIPLPQPRLIPEQNFLFNDTWIPHAEKYLKLTESGFVSPWQLPPLGCSLFVTVHGDTRASSIAADSILDARAASISCSFICLGTLPGPVALKLLKSFLLSGPKFQPEAKHIKTIEVIRGDTIFIPPLVLYRLEYQHDTLTATGIFMLKKNMRLALESWKWDALSQFRRGYQGSLQLLNVIMKEVFSDPAGTGWAGARLVEGRIVVAREEKDALMDTRNVIKEKLREEWQGSQFALNMEQQRVARAWEAEREKMALFEF